MISNVFYRVFEINVIININYKFIDDIYNGIG